MRSRALIEDCAQAQLSELEGRLAGTMGDIGCFSFNNTKHLNCGEGGMVVTNDDAFARRARLFATIRRFLDGTEPLPPGLVPVDRWHAPGSPPPPPGDWPTPFYGAVARKP